VTESTFEAAIGYSFQDPDRLNTALTHRSHAFEQGGPDNERLEYLGDSILNACTTVLLVERFPDVDEGSLSRLRSRLVNTETLAEIGRNLGIGEALRLGRGEAATGGRDKASLLADATEAVVGAVFLDAGFERCRAMVAGWMESRLELLETPAEAQSGWIDPRSRLQEWTQQHWRATPTYHVTASEGPSHAPQFDVEVRVGDRALGTGRGGSKRDAARSAATVALASLPAEAL
jgi:ribonuclease-3